MGDPNPTIKLSNGKCEVAMSMSFDKINNVVFCLFGEFMGYKELRET
jgi:hypothetical protein